MSGRVQRTKIRTGIYQDEHGYGVIASVGTRPHLLTSPEIRFPPGTAIPVMEARWYREKMKLKDLQAKNGTKVVRGTLAADKARYFLVAVLSPQRTKEREQQLTWWVQKFGHRLRASLEPQELQAALNMLPGSASTKNKYRTALSNVFTVLDGKNAANPFRELPRAKEPKAARLDQPYELIQVILAKIRDRGRGKKPSRTKAFMRVRAYAPVTQAQLNRMTAGDVDYTTGELATPGREKGEGTDGRRKPLSTEALEAFRAFDAAECWGKTPSKSSIWRIFARARDEAIVELRAAGRVDLIARAATMSPKDLRHSFATMAFQTTGNLDVVQDLLDHADKKTTLRYAQGALSPLLKTAGQAIAGAFATVPPYVPPPAPPVEVPTRRVLTRFQTKVPDLPVAKSGNSRKSLGKTALLESDRPSGFSRVDQTKSAKSLRK